MLRRSVNSRNFEGTRRFQSSIHTLVGKVLFLKYLFLVLYIIFGGLLGDQFLVTLMDLFQGGSETSGNFMSFATLLLASHPSVQEKLFQELKSVEGPKKLEHMKKQVVHNNYIILCIAN